MKTKVSIIGGGNMGGAIANGLATSKAITPDNITVINKSRKRVYAKGINSVLSDYSSLRDADIIIVAVKPWQIEDIIKKEINLIKDTSPIIVSVVAGVSLQEIQSWMKHNMILYRLMPNTAISECESMNILCSSHSSKEANEHIRELFSNLGTTTYLPEEQFEAATALSSCGIAFAFRYIRAAIEGGVELGIDPKLAQKMVVQTLKGAVSILEQDNTHPETEIDKVTTPGGITIKGLNAMEHAGFTSAVIKGLKASCIKS